MAFYHKLLLLCHSHTYSNIFSDKSLYEAAWTLDSAIPLSYLVSVINVLYFCHGTSVLNEMIWTWGWIWHWTKIHVDCSCFAQWFAGIGSCPSKLTTTKHTRVHSCDYIGGSKGTDRGSNAEYLHCSLDICQNSLANIRCLPQDKWVNVSVSIHIKALHTSLAHALIFVSLITT